MPQPAPQTIVAATGRRLETFAASQDIALAPLAQSLGIDTATFTRIDLRIGLEPFMRLLRLLEVVSGDDCTGLRFAEHFQMGDTGPFGLALINAPSLREALRIYGSYQRISADCGHFEIAEANGRVDIRWRYAQPAEDPSQYADFHAALIVKVLRRYLGEDWVPQRTDLQRNAPRELRRHRSHFGPAITFGTFAGNAISLPATALEARSSAADPRLFEMMEASCRSMLAALDRSKDLRLRILEQVAASLPAGEARLERIADVLGMSERSLQRRLGELGTTFEELVEQARRDLSDRLLATDTPLAEISYRCGYSNASAYSRAARSWYGMAPLAKRQQLRGTGI